MFIRSNCSIKSWKKAEALTLQALSSGKSLLQFSRISSYDFLSKTDFDEQGMKRLLSVLKSSKGLRNIHLDFAR